jgi:F-type H+-transporting ATPase subunit b
MQRRRLHHSILSVLFLAMIVAAGLANPLRLFSQPTSAAAQPAANSTASHEAAKPEEAQKSEADANDVYLHAPKVKKFADLLHLDVKTTARIALGINFLILVLGLSFIIFRFLPEYWLPNILRNRSEKLRTDIESTRKITEDAYTRLSAIEIKLSALDDEIAQIRAQVEIESREDEKRIKSTIKEESERIVASAAQEIGSAAAQARRSLRHFAADLAIEQAAKQLAITPETDRALIAEFLGDTAITRAAKGGRK